MKKGIIAVLAVLLLSSCGGKAEISEISEISVTLPSTEESETTVILESNTKEVSRIEFSSVQYDKPYRTLQECIDNSESISAMIDSISDEDNENTDSNVFVENDTTLVFERKLKENTVYSDTFAEDTEKALDEKKDEFSEIVNLFEWGIDNDNITVMVRYRDKDGKVIFEKEFDNENE